MPTFLRGVHCTTTFFTRGALHPNHLHFFEFPSHCGVSIYKNLEDYSQGTCDTDIDKQLASAKPQPSTVSVVNFKNSKTKGEEF